MEYIAIGGVILLGSGVFFFRNIIAFLSTPAIISVGSMWHAGDVIVTVVEVTQESSVRGLSLESATYHVSIWENDRSFSIRLAEKEFRRMIWKEGLIRG